LLWRAGFGPKPGEAARVARKGLSRAVDDLVNPPKSRLIGRRVGGTRTFVIPETLPGERTTRTFRLPPGRYRVWCSVADHHEQGMRATLRVRRD
jgi:hypothetical protein